MSENLVITRQIEDVESKVTLMVTLETASEKSSESYVAAMSDFAAAWRKLLSSRDGSEFLLD